MRLRCTFASWSVPTILAWMALGGCGSTARTPTVSRAPEPSSPGYLVWGIANGQYTTHWVAAGQEDEGFSRGHREVALFAVGESLWAWDEQPVRFRGTRCVLGDDPPRTVPDEVTATRHTLVRRGLARIEEVVLDPEARARELEPGESESTRVTPLASWGPLLFVRNDTVAGSCGAAHPSSHTEVLVVRLTPLRSQEYIASTELLTPDDRQRIDASLRDEASGTLATLLEGTVPLERESIRIEAFWPAIERGAGRAMYVYAADTCYACSSGDWSSSTIAVTRAGPMPQALAPAEQVPRAVLRFMDLYRSVAVRGYTVLPAGASERTRMWRHFHDPR